MVVPALPELVSRDSTYGRLLERGDLSGTSLVTIVVVCRLYIRWRTTGLGPEDLAIFLAACCKIADAVVIDAKLTRNALGMHVWKLTREQREEASHWLLVPVFQSYIILFLIRFSVGLFLLRLMVNGTHQRRLRHVVLFSMLLNVLLTVALITLVGSSCRPLRALWHVGMEAKCMSTASLNIGIQVLTGCSAAVDMLYGTLPTVIFWKLNLPMKRKLNMLAITSLALVICVCAIGKTVTIDVKNADFTWANDASITWGTLGVDLGIIVVCLPAMRQFYVAIAKKLSKLREHRKESNCLTDNAAVGPDSRARQTFTCATASSYRTSAGSSTLVAEDTTSINYITNPCSSFTDSNQLEVLEENKCLSSKNTINDSEPPLEPISTSLQQVSVGLNEPSPRRPSEACQDV